MSTPNYHLPGNPFEIAGSAAPRSQHGIVGAIMAVAYEQRTANLIALHAIRPTRTLHEQIEARITEGEG